MIERIWSGLWWRWQEAAARVAVRRANRVIHGPDRVDLREDEVAVVTLMKNAAYFIGPFIRHHQALGVRHIIIVDNGSGDDTVAIAQGFERVTVIRNRLPAKRYECVLRQTAARQVLRGGWVLFADADEMFEVPLGAPLPTLMRYLNAGGYTAMMTQMLELFSPEGYGAAKTWEYDTVLARADRYSLGQMRDLPYHGAHGLGWYLDRNSCAAPLTLKLGGLRQEVFGEDCLLSKHSLVRNLPGIGLMAHPHCAVGVRVADVTGLLRHYKFAGDYLARDRASVAAGTWDHAEDAKRLAAAAGGDDFAIRPAASARYDGAADLVDQGFLVASDAYRRAVRPSL